MKPMENMTPEELFVEAGAVRKQIVSSAEKLGRIYMLMYAHVRKNPTEYSSTFVSISNAGKRFAGSVVHGAKRTEVVDRVLEATRTAIREAAEFEAQRKKRDEDRKARAEKQKKQQSERRPDVYGVFVSSNEITYDQTPIDNLGSDLDALYGEE